jgi:seryl-tRNA synthetase
MNPVLNEVKSLKEQVNAMEEKNKAMEEKNKALNFQIESIQQKGIVSTTTGSTAAAC